MSTIVNTKTVMILCNGNMVFNTLDAIHPS